MIAAGLTVGGLVQTNNMQTVAARIGAIAAIALLGACSGGGPATPSAPTVAVAAPVPVPTPPKPVIGVSSQVVATIEAPWAMAFLPDARMLVTERPPTPTTLWNPIEPGRLRIVTPGGVVSAPVAGLPDNVGLLDVKLDPQFATNRFVYITFMERDPAAPRVGNLAADTRIDPAGLALMRFVFESPTPGAATVTAAKVIWRQTPKIVSYPGSGEPGGRMAFSPDGTYLFVAAGDRQEMATVQSLGNTLGKVIRLFADGSIPKDNPFTIQPGALPEIWTLGHRNPYGLVFNAKGELWENEMGPKGGDELNLIIVAANYGWPNVSYGDNYDGGLIPKPAPGDGFMASAYWWTPVIAPSGMIFYSGSVFGDWTGDAIISGLQSKGLVRVRMTGTTATEVQRIDLGTRIRFVIEGPDGAIWVIEDQPAGRILKLSPQF